LSIAVAKISRAATQTLDGSAFSADTYYRHMVPIPITRRIFQVADRNRQQ
jgi:hypothetical protein